MTDTPPRNPRPSLPPEFEALFWDCDPATLDLERHREHVIERVLQDGSLATVRWLLEYYGDDAIRSFVLEKGRKRLHPKILSFWYAFYDLGEPPCTRKSSLIDSERGWRY